MGSTTLQTHIESTPGVCGGKPRIKGSRIRVQDVYVWHYRQGKSPEEIVAEHPHLTLGGVHSALAYYWDHRDEIHRDLEEADRLVGEMKDRFPSKLRAKLQGWEPEDDTIWSGRQ